MCRRADINCISFDFTITAVFFTGNSEFQSGIVFEVNIFRINRIGADIQTTGNIQIADFTCLFVISQSAFVDIQGSQIADCAGNSFA